MYNQYFSYSHKSTALRLIVERQIDIFGTSHFWTALRLIAKRHNAQIKKWHLKRCHCVGDSIVYKTILNLSLSSVNDELPITRTEINLGLKISLIILLATFLPSLTCTWLADL